MSGQITIATATYNHEKHILEFLNSIPDFYEHNIIVSDGGSVDETQKLAQQWAKDTSHPNFTFIGSNARLWEGENVRRVLNAVKTPFVLKCDPDIILCPEIYDLKKHVQLRDVAAAIPDQNKWGLHWWRQLPYGKDGALTEIEVLLATCFMGDISKIMEAGSWQIEYPYGGSEWGVAYELRIRGHKVVFDHSINIHHNHLNLDPSPEIKNKILENWIVLGQRYKVNTLYLDSRGIPYGWRSLPYNQKFYAKE
jgi:glycosyltransferase involved in cell wall biosynthesis